LGLIGRSLDLANIIKTPLFYHIHESVKLGHERECRTITFQQIIQSIEALSDEEQERLFEVLYKRRIETRRSDRSVFL